jgi:hypothetical protein
VKANLAIGEQAIIITVILRDAGHAGLQIKVLDIAATRARLHVEIILLLIAAETFMIQKLARILSSLIGMKT